MKRRRDWEYWLVNGTVAALATVRARLPDNAPILIPLSGSGLKES